MPRIRKLKNYDPFGRISYEDGETELETQNSNSIYHQPKGWWSSANIIASLPDAKLKERIEFHRQQISLLQNELLTRHISGRNKSNGSSGYACYKSEQQTTIQEEWRVSKVKAFPGLTKLARKCKRLSKEQQDILVVKWELILKEL
jgi:hypothetical protein